jgi:hypothetical protein
MQSVLLTAAAITLGLRLLRHNPRPCASAGTKSCRAAVVPTAQQQFPQSSGFSDGYVMRATRHPPRGHVLDRRVRYTGAATVSAQDPRRDVGS